VGIVFSAIIVYGGAGAAYTSVLQFSPDIFLYALLVRFTVSDQSVDAVTPS